MRTIHKNWLWVIGGLLLLNISLLAFIWIKKPDHKPPPFLEEKLNLSDSQKERFEQFRKEHRSKMDDIKEEIDTLKDELYAHFPKEGYSTKEVEGIARKLGAKKAEADVLTFQHFKNLREICTPEQQQEFDQLINEVVRGMGSPMPPRGERERRKRRDGPPEGRRPPPRQSDL